MKAVNTLGGKYIEEVGRFTRRRNNYVGMEIGFLPRDVLRTSPR